MQRSQAFKVFNDKEEDSELRIAAYLALMQCPSKSILSTFQSALEKEEVNQVGSFIWSHLTNLMESSSPLKQDIRSILENEYLKKEFDMDKRKFSRNYEGSFFLEKINTGASVESNLIWSSNSFIPRSLMANLTVDLFGRSVNILEIGGRVEGLEYFLESYFGPNGYFTEKDVKKATSQVVKGIDAKKMKKIDSQVYMTHFYIHIPFCKQACHYCDFHFSTSMKLKGGLISALLKELDLRNICKVLRE